MSKILVVPTAEVDSIFRTEGFIPYDESGFLRLLEYGEFRERDEVETDFSYKQLIPYVIFSNGDNIFVYQRSSTSDESRLRKKYSIGIDVGGTKIAYGLFDEELNLIDKCVTKTNSELLPEDMLDEMTQVCKNLLTGNSVDITDLKGVGAGFPCHIDFDKGLVITGSNLPTWNNVPVKQLFSERLGVRVEIDNDANVLLV